uniref:FKBP-type peptidyl-prolyl cis-trans isomerase n=1 Tax=Agathobacter sp. TaxID=2021311 RepID=UPI00405630DD
MKKRLVAMMLCAAMAFSVCACGDNKEGNASGTETENTEEITITEEDLPTVEKIADYSDIDAILKDEYAVTEDEISQGFSSFMANHGMSLVEVTDRDTVQEGDIVNIDYAGYENGEAFSGGSAEDQYVDVTKNCGINASTGATSTTFIDGFTSGLLGAKVGGTAKSEVTFPEEYDNADLAGKPATFEFTVHGIYTVVTEDNITDAVIEENFKEVYGISTLPELMEHIKEELTYNAIMGYLMDNSSFEISDKYVDYRTNQFVKYQEEMLYAMYGESMDLDTYLTYANGYTVEQILPTWKEMMESQIMYEILCAKIAEKENLSLDEEAFKEYILTMFSEDAAEEDFESYYLYVGAGNEEEGKNYLRNEKVVKEFMMDAYNKTAE